MLLRASLASVFNSPVDSDVVVTKLVLSDKARWCTPIGVEADLDNFRLGDNALTEDKGK